MYSELYVFTIVVRINDTNGKEKVLASSQEAIFVFPDLGDKFMLLLPATIHSTSQLFTILNSIDNLKICTGISNQKFEPLIQSHHGFF